MHIKPVCINGHVQSVSLYMQALCIKGQLTICPGHITLTIKNIILVPGVEFINTIQIKLCESLIYIIPYAQEK